MYHQRFLAAATLSLAISCEGKTLIVDESPDTTASMGNGGDGHGSSSSSPHRPCDVLAAEGHTCVAAHSTVRLLRSSYDGPLYQICHAADADAGPSSCQGEAKDISAASDGYADAQAQERFCGEAGCVITIVYDQSGYGNHLEPAPKGSNNATLGDPVAAAGLPTMIDGHAVYGMLFDMGMGYRAACEDCSYPEDFPSGVPTEDEPETIYMVTSQLDTNDGCCFDYGNASVTQKNDGNGTAEAVYIGSGVIWGTGVGEPPWVMADLENGLYPGWASDSDGDTVTGVPLSDGWSRIQTNTTASFDFVTAVVVGDTSEKNDGHGRFAIYAGDAQTGKLATMYDGIRPRKPGVVPMTKQGSVVLGIASDSSSLGTGRFYEGAIAVGAASRNTLDNLQTAIVAAKYGR